MTQKQSNFLKVIGAVAIPLLLSAVGYGVLQERVHGNEVQGGKNEYKIEQNATAISELQSKHSTYETDVIWIKQTLIEIKGKF